MSNGDEMTMVHKGVVLNYNDIWGMWDHEGSPAGKRLCTSH